MLQSSATSETLAHWHYTPNEWRDFANYELTEHRKIYKSYRNWFIGIIVVAGFIMISLVLIPFLMLKPWESIWRTDVWGPVFGVAVVTGIFLAAIGIYWLLLWNKSSSLRLPSGEVYITFTGVSVNGVWFNWGYEKVGWRFHNVKRKTITVVEGRNIEILEFKCSAYNRGSKLNQNLVKAERILIPEGRMAEAERIIERLLAEKNRFADNYAY